MRVKIFRWKAIGPLLGLLALLGILLWLFAEPIARQTTEEASTELLGTEVDVGRLDLLPRQAAVAGRAAPRPLRCRAARYWPPRWFAARSARRTADRKSVV